MISAYIWGPTSSIICVWRHLMAVQSTHEVDERNGIGRIGSYFRAKCFTSELNLCQPDLSEQKKIQATCFISELTFAKLTYQSKKKSIRVTCFTSELNLFQPDLSEQSAACPALRYLPPSFDPAAVGFQIHIKPASCHSDISAGGLCNWIYQSCSLSLLLICSA